MPIKISIMSFKDPLAVFEVLELNFKKIHLVKNNFQSTYHYKDVNFCHNSETVNIVQR